MMHELAHHYTLNAAIASQATQATQSTQAMLGLAEHTQQHFTSELAALVATERQALETLRGAQRSTQQAAQQAVSNAKSRLDNYQSDIEGKQALLRTCEGARCSHSGYVFSIFRIVIPKKIQVCWGWCGVLQLVLI